jgi:hypothetical protein
VEAAAVVEVGFEHLEHSFPGGDVRIFSGMTEESFPQGFN